MTKTVEDHHTRLEGHFFSATEMMIRTIERVGDHHQHMSIKHLTDEPRYLEKQNRALAEHFPRGIIGEEDWHDCVFSVTEV